MKRFFLLLLFAFAVNSKFSAQLKDTAKYAFTIQQAIDFALNNNTRIQNAGFDEEIAQNKVHEIVGSGLPQLSGTFDVKDFINIPTQVIPASAFMPTAPKDALAALKFGVNYNATGSLTATQLLFSTSYIVGLQASKTYMELAQKATKRTKIETAASVTKAYYTCLVNNERMKLLEANIVRIKNLYDGTKSLNTNGFVEKVDLDRVTVAYNNLLAEREKTQRLLGLSVALLKYQIGMAQSATLTLSDNLEGISFQPENLSTEPSYANRIEYSLAETQKRAAFLQLKNDKLSFLPSAVLYLNAGASAMRMKFDVFDPSEKWYPFTILGGTVNVPIFSGLQKNYRIQQSKIALKKADNDLKYAQQSIELEQTNTRIALQNATQTLDIQKKNIEVAEEVYKATKLKYENGVGLNYEVISAETALKEAQTNYFGALFDALVAKVDYQKSIGVLIK